jgi:TolB-like protein
MLLRIGINLGDILIEGDDILGDGVNVAARLEGIAEPGGICISSSAHDQVSGKVAVEFADLGEQNLKNIARPVRVYAAKSCGTAAPQAPQTASSHPEVQKPLPLPDKPSIAVLPFQNMSGDPEQEYFADGVVEDIISALSHFKSLFVIARNSSFTYKGKPVDIKQVGRELGVRYVLEGSVRRAGANVRITGQLIDATTGAHLWADRFDGRLDDVFELQDRVASSVAAQIDPVLQEAENRHASARPTEDLTSYQLYLRSKELIDGWSRESIGQAIVLLRQAVERDPHYGLALGSLAFCHSQNIWSGWSEDADADVEQRRVLARRASEAAPDDTEVIAWAAGALMNLGDDINVLKGMIDNGLARNPSSARGWFYSGWMRVFSAENNLAIEHFEKSLRLDPRVRRRAFHLTGIGICHFYERRFDKSASYLEGSFHELPTYPTTKWFLAACYAHMGRLDEARDFAARNDIVAGGSWVQLRTRFAVRNPEQQEFLLAGIALATGGKVAIA